MAGRNKPAFTPTDTTRGWPKRSSLFPWRSLCAQPDPLGYAVECGALMPTSRALLPTRPDRFQQFALAGVSISKNGHNHHRQDFGVRVQWVETLIRADPIEHAFANSQIVRAEAGAIEAPTQHLCEPFRARCPCCGGPLTDEPLRRWNAPAIISSIVYCGEFTRFLTIELSAIPKFLRTRELYTDQWSSTGSNPAACFPGYESRA